MDDGHQGGRRSDNLVSVNLPPLPAARSPPLLGRRSAATGLPPLPSRPGTAVRLRPPTPPPRPDATLLVSSPPPPAAAVRLEVGGDAASSSSLLFSSLQGGMAGLRPLDPSPPSAAPVDQTITLTNPRTVRTQNVYVDTPIKGLLRDDTLLPPPSAIVKRSRVPHNHHHHHHHPHHFPKQKSSNPSNTVITQPLSTASLKKSAAGLPPAGGGSPTSPTDSIMCSECNRCRCAACRSARPLPSAWLCDNWCECSVETVIDYATCMCCVKAGLYHCGDLLTGDPDTRDQTWVDKPCSCTSSKRVLRWGCLSVLWMPLPCLLCYPLLKGTAKLVEKVYQSATINGCRCPDASSSGPTTTTAPTTPLSSSSSSSSAAAFLSSAVAASPTDSQKRLLS